LDKPQHGAFDVIPECAHNIHTTELVPRHTLTIRVIHKPNTTTTTIHIHIDECAVEHQKPYTAARANPSGIPTRCHHQRDIHERYRKRSDSKKEDEEESTSTSHYT